MSCSPSVTGRPTERELDLELVGLVNWQIFATHLPDLTRGDIEQIEQDNRDVQRQKLELYGTWLRRCPSASWTHIVLGLENARENTLADIIKMKFNVVISSDSFISNAKEAHNPVQLSSNQEVSLLSEEIVVKDLQKLHRSFTSLARDVRCKLDELVKFGKSSLHAIAVFIQEARVCGIKGLTKVRTIDELFDAILPYNDYLDCELLEMIVEEYLDVEDITKVKAHIEKVKHFKRTTPIKDLKNRLQQYTSVPNISDMHLIVTIKLQADWGRVTLESIEKLVQNLLQYQHKVRILKVEPGSISVMLLLPKEKLQHFIVSSSQKLQFMRLTGIFRLQIGDTTVHEQSKNKNFTFRSAFLQSSQCGNDEALQFLLDLGVNIPVNYSNSEGKTALILGSESGQEEVVQMLLSAGANPNICTNAGCTALAFACHHGYLKVLEILLHKGADPNIQANNGWTALLFACQNGHHRLAETLLKKDADPDIRSGEGQTALMLASYNGHIKVVELLLNKKADPNIPDNNRWTALMFASFEGHLQIVDLLLKKNADPSIRSLIGWTALIIASCNGHLQAVELLLDKKADPNIPNNYGWTALMFASQNGYLRIVELLLKKNANPIVCSNTGRTALLLATKNGHSDVIKILLQHKATSHVKTPLESFTIYGSRSVDVW